MRYFIRLSYNGKNYHGWQIQPNAITIQETLEKALSMLLRKPITIVGAGRTDTGVHALNIFTHFDYDSPINNQQLVFKLNSFLPNDIAIKEIFKVNENAHARFDAICRTYSYFVSITKNPFENDFSYTIPYIPDLDKMNKACQILMQYNDFECFSKSKTDVKTFRCNLSEAFWQKDNEKLIFTITSDRFLRNMVRAIVGTLLEIGKEDGNPDMMHKIIKSKKRAMAGTSVPAAGLFLKNVCYPNTIILKNE